MWERYLGQQKYAATDAFTIAGTTSQKKFSSYNWFCADVVLAPGICVYARIGMTFKDHPNLKRYHEMIKAPKCSTAKDTNQLFRTIHRLQRQCHLTGRKFLPIWILCRCSRLYRQFANLNQFVNRCVPEIVCFQQVRRRRRRSSVT